MLPPSRPFSVSGLLHGEWPLCWSKCPTQLSFLLGSWWSMLPPRMHMDAKAHGCTGAKTHVSALAAYGCKNTCLSLGCKWMQSPCLKCADHTLLPGSFIAGLSQNAALLLRSPWTVHVPWSKKKSNRRNLMQACANMSIYLCIYLCVTGGQILTCVYHIYMCVCVYIYKVLFLMVCIYLFVYLFMYSWLTHLFF